MGLYRGSVPGLLLPSRGLYRGAANIRPNTLSEGDYTVDVPAYVNPPAYQSVAYSAGFTASVGKPSGTLAGDFLLGVFAGSDTDTAVTPPAGWTAVGTTVSVNSGGQIVPAIRAYKFAGASEPSSYTFTAPNWKVGAILRYTGVDVSSPVQAFGHEGKASGAASSVVPTLTADRNNSALVSVSLGFEGTGPSSTPAGMTSRASWSGGENAAFTQTVNAGSVGGGSFTASGTNVILTLAVVLNPAS